MDDSQPKASHCYQPFIPAALDDYGLTSPQFRVLCHLQRRAGRDRTCYPAVRSIAKTCKLHRDTVWACIKELERLNLIQRLKGQRNSNRYILQEIRVGGNRGPTQANELTETQGPELTEPNGHELAALNGQQSAETEGHKGYPIEGHPKKGIQRSLSKEAASQISKPSGEAKKTNERDPLLDAFAAIDGGNPLQVPARAWSGIREALADIQSVCPDVTAEEIRRRAANYLLHHPNVTISHAALARHWAKCEHNPPVIGSKGGTSTYELEARVHGYTL